MRAFKCPHCAGDVKYDASRAAMRCEHCGSEITREEYQAYLDENRLYATNELVCPQCGAAMLSYDDTLATFCAYCGSSVSFTKRIVEDSKPESVVPFQVTGEQALEYYRSRIRRTVFTPDWLAEGGEDKLVGIYMPYYSYTVTARQQLWGEATRIHDAAGGYETSSVKCDLKATYKEIRFDAAEAFPDFLSSSMNELAIDEGQVLELKARPFETSYLAGFYADGGNAREKDYRIMLEQMVRTDLSQQKLHFQGADLKVRADNPELEMEQTKLLYPVWLNTHRRGDRVTYAAIDGDNGNVAAELPIDWKKFLKIALILTAIFAVVLNLLFTIKPLPFLCVAGILLVVMGRLLVREAEDVYLRQEHLDDVGRVGLPEFQRVSKTKPRRLRFVPLFFVGLGWILLYGGILLGLLFLATLIGLESSHVAFLAIGGILFLAGGVDLILVNIAQSILDRGRYGNTGRQRPLRWISKVKLSVLLRTLWKPLLGAAIAAAVLFIAPVQDEYYYAAGILDLALALWSAAELIREHNLLTTREIPVFTMKRGGDENA